MSDSPGPGAGGFCYQASEFCFKLVRQASDVFLRNSNNRRTVKSILLVKEILGLVEWQAVKMIFFAD